MTKLSDKIKTALDASSKYVHIVSLWVMGLSVNSINTSASVRYDRDYRGTGL